VEAGVFLAGEAAGTEEGDGEGVADGEGDGGGGGGDEVEGAGFALDGGVEDEVGMLGEGGLEVAGEGDDARAGALEDGQEIDEFVGFAGVGEGEDGVSGWRRPRSPCMASEGCRTVAGAPVLVRVAAIFWPMWKDLPTPVTMILPPLASVAWRRSTAASNAPSRRSRVRWRAAISTSKTSWAFSRWESDALICSKDSERPPAGQGGKEGRQEAGGRRQGTAEARGQVLER
jgi:hypothetical protein